MVSDTRFTSQSPQRAVYMGSKNANVPEGEVNREALARALVKILLDEALTALKWGGGSTGEPLFFIPDMF